jgi:hypothetical protein
MIENKMNRYIQRGIYLALAGLTLTACHSDDEALNPQGAQLTVTLSDASVGTDTRTLPADLMTSTDGHLTPELAAQFALDITSQPGTADFRQSCTAGEGTLYLPLGSYALQARFGQNALIAWDAPYYTGQTTVSLTTQGERQTADIPCTMQNALASFETNIDGLLSTLMDQYAFRLIATDGQACDSLDWTPGQTEHPYFRAGSRLKCYLVGRKAATQQEFRISLGGELLSAQPAMRYHYKVYIEIDHGSSQGLSLTVDRSETPLTLTESIPETYLPAPKIEARIPSSSAYQFDALDRMAYCETGQADVSFALSTSRAASSATLTLTSMGPLADGTYDLLHLTDATLQAWQQAGVTYTADASGRAMQLDFGRLISQLNALADGTSVQSEATFRVTANGRTTERTFTVVTQYPQFSLVLDNRYCWTRTIQLGTLTVVQGDYNRLLSLLRFYYKEKGASEWKSVEADTRALTWEQCPTQKEYDIRAVYRDREVLNTTVQLEEPAQIPNSDFEEWTDDLYYKSSDVYYSFNPWIEKGDCHWDTNNCWTTRNRGNRSSNIARYNGIFAVSYTPGRQDGWAAKLTSTANGRGNMAATIRNYNKVPGQLFTGNASVTLKNTSGLFADADGSSDVKNFTPAPFASRPTGLTFWYTYQTYDGSDNWKAELILMDEAGQVIGSRTATDGTAQSAWTQYRMNLNFDDETVYNRCAKMYVRFSSSDQEGSAMPYNSSQVTVSAYVNLDASQAVTQSGGWMGSTLCIDDVELIYDK